MALSSRLPKTLEAIRVLRASINDLFVQDIDIELHTVNANIIDIEKFCNSWLETWEFIESDRMKGDSLSLNIGVYGVVGVNIDDARKVIEKLALKRKKDPFFKNIYTYTKPSAK